MKLKTTDNSKILCPVCGHPEFRSVRMRKKRKKVPDNEKFSCPRGHTITFAKICELVPVDVRNVPHPFWN